MKWIFGVSSLVIAVLGMHSAQELRSRYTRVESYEIRPGVLAMPKYAKDGTICQISIEKLHVQSDSVELGTPTMSHELVLEMIDELAPQSVRGNALTHFAGLDYVDEINGLTDVAVANYESISVRIFRLRSDDGDIAAILQWKRKQCGGWPRD